MKEIFPDLNEGFIVYSLLEHYKNEAEHMVRDMLEHNLPPPLGKVDKKLSMEDARKLVFRSSSSSSSSSAAAIEDEERFGLDLSKGAMTMGKQKVPEKMRYQDALKVSDASSAAKATLKFVARQDRDEEQRSYATQLKRARGEAVDEDDEALHEQLRASAELRERAERGGLTYDDEPDDSLDDFHPVGALADDSQDNLLARAKRGPLRSKFSNNTVPMSSTAIGGAGRQTESFSSNARGASGGGGKALGRMTPNQQHPVEVTEYEGDEEDQITKMQAEFEADDAALLPFTSSPSSHLGTHYGGPATVAVGSGGGSRQGGAGRGSSTSSSSSSSSSSSQGHHQQHGGGKPSGGRGSGGGNKGKGVGAASLSSATATSHSSQPPHQTQGGGRGKRSDGGGGLQHQHHGQGGGRGKSQQHSRGK